MNFEPCRAGGIALLSVSLFVSSASGFAEIRLLAQDVDHFTVLSETGILAADMEGSFQLIDINSPQASQAWVPDWDPTEYGWGRATTLVRLTSSSDGELVCFAQFLAIPEDVLGPDEYVAWPLAVVVCNSDGSDARIVALSQDAGGGPGFDFTTDGSYLYGQPFLRSGVYLEDYLAWHEGTATGGDPEGFTRIDVTTGARDGGDVDLSDGYVSCPWSDLVAAPDYWELRGIYDMATLELLHDAGSTSYGAVKWVTDNALLVSGDGCQALVLPDGRVHENSGSDPIEIYCRMPSGAYFFTTDGISVQFGSIDWRTFSPLQSCYIPELDGTLDSWASPLPTPDGSGIVYYAYLHGGLCYPPVPVRTVE